MADRSSQERDLTLGMPGFVENAEYDDAIASNATVNGSVVSDAVLNNAPVNNTVVNNAVANDTAANDSAANETPANETIANEAIVNEATVNESVTAYIIADYLEANDTVEDEMYGMTREDQIAFMDEALALEEGAAAMVNEEGEGDEIEVSSGLEKGPANVKESADFFDKLDKEFDDLASLKEIDIYETAASKKPTQEKAKEPKQAAPERIDGPSSIATSHASGSKGVAPEQANPTYQTASGQTKKLPDFLFVTPETQGRVKNIPNPYEELKKAGESGQSDKDKSKDIDDTYAFHEEIGGHFRDDDFTKYPVKAANPDGYTLYWEPGDKKKWADAFPELAKDLEQLMEKNVKIFVDAQYEDFDMELLDPPKGVATLWKLEDVLLRTDLLEGGHVFRLINGPKDLKEKWTYCSWKVDKKAKGTKGIGFLPDLGRARENKATVPSAVAIYPMADPLDRITLNRNLDSIDWFTAKVPSMGWVAMLVLIRAKVLAGDGIKVSSDGLWLKDEWSRMMLNAYKEIWPESVYGDKGRVPEDPFEADPDWNYYQTSGEGPPADAYNPGGPFFPTEASPMENPGIRLHLSRQEKYLANLFLRTKTMKEKEDEKALAEEGVTPMAFLGDLEPMGSRQV